MSTLSACLSEQEPFAGLLATPNVEKIFDPSASLSVEERSAVRGSIEPAIRAGQVYEALFRPLLAPFTAEVAWRPYRPKTIPRSADIELDPCDLEKLNGPVVAYFVLASLLETLVEDRQRFMARLIPPFPSQACAELVDKQRRIAQKEKENTERRMATTKNVMRGHFEVRTEELTEGKTIQVVSEGKVSKRTGRTDLFVLCESDYDLIDPSGNAFFRPTRNYETMKGIVWAQSPNYRAVAVNAMKRSYSSPKREMVLLDCG